MEAIRDQLKKQYADFKTTADDKKVDVNGTDAKLIEGTFTEDGVKKRGQAVIAVANGVGYFVSYTNAVDKFDKYKSLLKPIADSIDITAAPQFPAEGEGGGGHANADANAPKVIKIEGLEQTALPNMGISIKLPKGWELTKWRESSQSDSSRDAGGYVAQVILRMEPVKERTGKQILNETLDALKNNVPGFKRIDLKAGDDIIEADNLKGKVVLFEQTVDEDLTYKVALSIFRTDKHVYFVFCAYSSENYKKVEDDFRAVFQSFKVTGEPSKTIEMPKLMEFPAPNQNMTLMLPKGWQITENEDGCTFYSPDTDVSGARGYVVASWEAGGDKGIDALYKDGKEKLAKELKGYKFVSEDKATIDGSPARIITYDMTGDDEAKTKYRAVTALILKNKVAYYVTCYYAVGNFDALKDYFLKIINTAKVGVQNEGEEGGGEEGWGEEGTGAKPKPETGGEEEGWGEETEGTTAKPKPETGGEEEGWGEETEGTSPPPAPETSGTEVKPETGGKDSGDEWGEDDGAAKPDGGAAKPDDGAKGSDGGDEWGEDDGGTAKPDGGEAKPAPETGGTETKKPDTGGTDSGDEWDDEAP